jgi:transcriptional regulator with XRE-family HTH domain
MNLSQSEVRAWRERKAWSQQHLAVAAGLSLRTIQRLESEGGGSAETCRAVAAALGASLDDLRGPALAADGAEAGSGGVAVFAASAAAALFIIWQGSGLPERVASHFGFNGVADASMSRESVIGWMLLVAVGVPATLWALVARAVRHGPVNLPNAAYWLSAERRPATVRTLLRQTAWLGLGLTWFLCAVFWGVVRANLSGLSPAKLDARLWLGALAALLLFTGLWLYGLQRRFRLPQQPGAESSP